MQRLTFLRGGDYRYYVYTIVARVLIVTALTGLYVKARDPLFIVMNGVVLVGLVPSIYVALHRPARRAASYS